MKIKANKISYIIVLIAVLSIGIAYAAINRTLTISGNSEIKTNSWDIHFENVKIKEGSVVATTRPTTGTNTTSLDFSITLNLPGDFYEFTVDVKNTGTIDAMIDSISKTPNLTTAQQKYLNYVVEYQNGEAITTKQMVKANNFVRLKVRVEYKKDLTEDDLPTTTDNLTLGFTLNYIQADNAGIEVPNNGSSTLKFTVDGDEFEYENGMTWQDFIESDYNQGAFSSTYNSISYGMGCVYTDDSNPTLYHEIDGTKEYYSSICGRPDPNE